MKRIGGNINHQKSLKTKMPPFYGISTSILTGNRTDIVVKNHNDKTCFLIVVSVLSDTNVSHKIFEKISNYKDLEIEVPKMWHLKTTTLPVVTDALGMVAKTAPNHVLQIPKNNTHRHRTYSAKGTINVIFTFRSSYFVLFFYLLLLFYFTYLLIIY